jgi:predicted NBD/HSP70 family sugar kinase/plasmid maintenance system antidote protein VapI
MSTPTTPTLRDVAQLAGVSPATVSYIVNNSRSTSAETRMKVEKAISQLGFVPNKLGRMLAMRKHHTKQESNLIEDQTLSNSDETIPAISNRSVLTTLLRIVRTFQPVSPEDLAKRMGVDTNSITKIIEPLIESKVLVGGFGHLGIPVQLSLNTEQDYVIGVYIDARRTYIASASIDGKIISGEHFETSPDSISTIERIRLIIERIRSSFPNKSLSCVGLSVPGPTDKDRQRLLYAPHLGWNNVSIAEALRLKKFKDNRHGTDVEHVPVIVENRANAAAIYEARRRLHNCTDGTWNDFILIRVDDGIGSGLILGGELYRGAEHGMGFGGEFGHMTIVVGGKQCSCGNRGCWERYASASSAVGIYNGERARSYYGNSIHFLDIVAWADAGEMKAQRCLERIGEYLGIGIGNILNGLGIPRVIVGGPIVYGWRFIENRLHKALSNTLGGQLYNWVVDTCKPSGDGIGGAIEVAIDHHIDAITEIMPVN